MSPEMNAAMAHLARNLAMQGRLIEAGFVNLRVACIPEDAPPPVLHAMRMAYLAGAMNTYRHLMQIMDVDPAEDPTPAAMHKMAMITMEVEAFEGEVGLWAATPRGTA